MSAEKPEMIGRALLEKTPLIGICRTFQVSPNTSTSCSKNVEALPFLVGRDMESGELPDDFEMVGGMVKRICYANARDFLGLETEE